MSASPIRETQVACPSCQTPIRVGIVSFIDADMFPQLKNILIGGRLNSASCQACGTPVMLAAPLVYHDANKQFCFVHIPQQLLASAQSDDMERYVGSITNALMQQLPPEVPRGYLLNPKRFLTMQTLVEAVLEGDGVTKEMLEMQRKRVDLISQLLEGMMQGDEALLKVLQANQDDMDEEFTATLAAFVEASQASGDPEGIQQLSALQSKIAQFVGGENIAQYNILIDKLMANDDAAVRTQLIKANQESIDYTFFDLITNRVNAANEAGDTDLAQTLDAMREHILALYEEIQAGLEAAYIRAGALLDSVFSAEDMAAVLAQNIEQLDDIWEILVDGQRTMAERAGDQASADRLSQIIELSKTLKESTLSPEDRIVNALIESENPTRYIRENIGDITGVVVKRLNELADQHETNGKTDDADKVRRIAREAGAMLF
ncbi:MAG: CpXC domain-containing protein [Roseiflexaceae bacterium]